jgi:hypothetical protein
VILVNDGSGAFSTQINVGAGNDSRSMVVTDADGDGRDDLAVANYTGGDVTILLNVTEAPVAVGDGPAIVSSVGLFNAPNPFRSQTAFSISLEAEERAVLEIFDVSGRRVVTVVDGVLAAGQHLATWDGLTDAGNEAPAGIYLSRLVVGDRIVRGRVMRLR